jgi:hypothetical protein
MEEVHVSALDAVGHASGYLTTDVLASASGPEP